MELRYNEVERSRGIFERYVQCLPTVKAWVRYAKFEMQNGAVDQARTCYERSVEQLAEDAQTVTPPAVAIMQPCMQCPHWGNLCRCCCITAMSSCSVRAFLS